ncbi:hypothetical protein [Rubrivirga sp. IMCC45206]|uniref:hypothetical protein n=1 Tax=Rubrivirga sp. IMCC45206 TaxID=3391614 RepID=UPI0039902732
MSDTAHPHDPRHVLRPDETLLWQGQPDPSGTGTRAVRMVRRAGYLMAVLFVFFLLMGWANRDEMEGAGGILAVFLLASGGLAVGFVLGIPALSRALLRSTRYAVTNERAVVVRGLMGRTEVLRYPIGATQTITVANDTDGLVSVLFSRVGGRSSIERSSSTTAFSMRVGFDRLTPAAGAAARAALDRIRGKAGSGAALLAERG